VASGTRSPSKRDDYVPKHAPAKRRGRAAAPRDGRRTGRPAKATSPGAGSKRSFLRRRWWLILLLTPVLVGVLGVIAFVIAYARTELPDRLPPVQTSFVKDRNGEVLAELHGAVNRQIVSLDEMSPNLIDAVLATEDHAFYEHSGVDPIGILRAAWTNVRGADNEVQGASTITQQLVKNVYAGEYVTDEETGLQEYIQPPRTVSQKLREIMLAIKLEREYGKDRILAQYLNTVYFGQGAYGIEAAAQTYFATSASELTVLESATLAGVLHAPELYDPIDRPEDSVFRRDYALDQMVRYGFLDAQTAEKLKARKCCQTVKENRGEQLIAPGQSEYFVDFVRQQLLDSARYGSARVYGGGLQITTTLDQALQQKAQELIYDTYLPLDSDPDGALVTIDVDTGEILAMVGGESWARSKFNLATFRSGTGRQAGSAFKIFTLAAAMEQGYDLQKVWSGPETVAIPDCPDPTSSDGVWHPVNAEGSGTGTLAYATANSVNTVFAQLIADLDGGPEAVVDVAHRLGIESELPATCSITLGSVGVNPLEMTQAYATVAAEGVRHDASPFLEVTSPTGRIDRTFRPDTKGDVAMERNDALLVTSALEGVIDGGTGSSAAIPGYPAAGKTGTANENVDVWFCGYTTQIATCVWVGYPEEEIPLLDIHGYPALFGGTIPAAIWQDYMTFAVDHLQLEPEPFPAPTVEGYDEGPSEPVFVSPSVEPSLSPSPEPTDEPSPEPTDEPSPEPTDEPSPEPTDGPSPSQGQQQGGPGPPNDG
jgi:penicillin-binding protein 1A